MAHRATTDSMTLSPFSGAFVDRTTFYARVVTRPLAVREHQDGRSTVVRGVVLSGPTRYLTP
jgi:hypothetical protein